MSWGTHRNIYKSGRDEKEAEKRIIIVERRLNQLIFRKNIADFSFIELDKGRARALKRSHSVREGHPYRLFFMVLSLRSWGRRQGQIAIVYPL